MSKGGDRKENFDYFLSCVVRKGDSEGSEKMYRFPRIDRLPPYVFATVDQLKMDARRKGEDIIDLGMGNPDLPTPKHIVEKLVEAVQKGKNHRYSASRGITKLRYAISVWAKIPDRYARMDSLEFSKLLIKEANVAVSPGIGFGQYGEGYIRFALVENKHRINQAIRGINTIL